MASLKSLKKGVRSGVGSGSGSISQRYGSGDPDPHQNVPDPQHWLKILKIRNTDRNADLDVFPKGLDAVYKVLNHLLVHFIAQHCVVLNMVINFQFFKVRCI